ncbi:MAG: hypothetical protein HZB92_05540 [Euryarchaeota archaeon]|nr:hypothetical protein [Euryarchaeota archaeon]
MTGAPRELSDYSMEEIYLAAIKSETEANGVYSKLAAQMKGDLLKARLLRLADDENKHATVLIQMFLKDFPGMSLNIPDKSPIPLPDIKDPMLYTPCDVLESAIKAEWGAMEFYGAFSDIVKADAVKAMTLEYFYTMELGHMRLLEIELAYMKDKSGRMYDEAMGYIDEIIGGTSKDGKDDTDVI